MKTTRHLFGILESVQGMRKVRFVQPDVLEETRAGEDS